MRDLTTLQLVLLIVSATLLAGAAASYGSTKRFLRSAKKTSGTVLENVRSTDADGQAYFSPRFAFEDDDGNEIIVLSSAGTSPPSFRKGQQVTVLYDPLKPDQAKINSFFQLWAIPIVCVAGALVLSVVSYLQH